MLIRWYCFKEQQGSEDEYPFPRIEISAGNEKVSLGESNAPEPNCEVSIAAFDRVQSTIRTLKESAGFKMFATDLTFLNGTEIVATVESHSKEYLAHKQSEFMFELLETHET